MYLRLTQRRNRDGATVAYYGLAENLWNPTTRRAEARVVHSFGRADKLDREALKRLVKSINRVLDAEESAPEAAHGLPEIEIERVFELGVVLVAQALWEELGIGQAIRQRLDAAGLSAPHEAALFAMAANRLDDPTSKLACAERWLPDVAWLPEARGSRSISSIAPSMSWPGRPRGSSRRSSSVRPTSSSSTSTSSSTTPRPPGSPSTRRTRTGPRVRLGSGAPTPLRPEDRGCAGAAIPRTAPRARRRSWWRSP